MKLFALLSILAFSGLCVMSAQTPAIIAGGTVNSADYSRNIAPGALFSVFGSNFAAAESQASALPLPANLGGAAVEIEYGGVKVDVPLYFVSPRQINAQMPYDVAGATVQVRVRTSAGTSNADQIVVQQTAPRFFTVTVDGKGRAVTTHADYNLVNRANPVKPGETVLLYMNALGAVNPAVAAGEAPGDNSASRPLNKVTASVTGLLNGSQGVVQYSGLAPGFPGLYQVNLQTPYYDIAGDVDIAVRAGDGQTQAQVTLPVEPNGWYYVIPAGKLVNGQTYNGTTGANGAVAFRHEDVGTWGDLALKAWSKEMTGGLTLTPFGGLALTMKNGAAIVYDNNGIETGTHNNFYNNLGGGTDNTKPGLYTMVSMSALFPIIYAGYFQVNEPTTVTEIVGYFDGNGIADLRFDPSNIYNKFRMNIFRNGASQPDVNGFTGDVFSSDTQRGAFSYSDTGVKRVFSNGAEDSIYRLVYKLEQPLTLQAGGYWFSHDMWVPSVPNGTTATVDSVRYERPRPDKSITNQQ